MLNHLSWNNVFRSFAIAAIVASIVIPFISTSSVQAAQITNRTLQLIGGTVDTDSDGINDGGSMPGGTVSHEFTFDLVGATDTGSIFFEYCTTAAAVPLGIDCNLPTGLDTTSATLGAESGATGFTGIDTTTNGTVIINRTSAAAATGTVSYQLDDVLNPSTANETFFVRISTHNSLDGTGAEIDSGTVAASTATPIELTGTMPESLVFCTGETIGTTSSVPDCTTATPGTVAFDQLFSPTSTATATSQMAASTNAGSGYSITVNGPTLTSGANTINAMAATNTSVLGVSQFGMNLKDNATPDTGIEVAPVFNGTNYNGQAATDYDTADTFKFADGNSVANSNSTGTDSQIFTATYIVNVPGSQPAGTYTTTLTYICTATF